MSRTAWQWTPDQLTPTLREALAAPGDVADAFFGALHLGAAVIFVMVLAATVLSWQRNRKLNLLWSGTLAVAGFALVVWVSYVSTFDRFIALDANSSELRLRFVGPRARDVALSAAAIDTVLFGWAGKSNHRCYVTVQSKSGDRYRSATLDQHLSACKELRMRILQALATPTSS